MSLLNSLKITGLVFFIIFSGTHAIDRVIWFFGLYSVPKALVLSLVFTSIVIFCLWGIFATANHKKLWVRIILGLPLCLSAFVGSVYESVTGAIINFNSVATLINNLDFMDEAFATYQDNIVLPLVSSAIGYLSILLPHIKILFFSNHFKQGKIFHLFRFSNIAMPIAPYPVLFFVMMLYLGNGFEGIPMQYKVSIPWIMYYVNDAISPKITRRPPDLPLVSENTPDKDIIVIMDESIRGDFLDININRGTTPSLLKRQHKIINFGQMLSSSNCSRTSNLAIRFIIRPDSAKSSYYHNPSIWSFAHLAGYKPIYIDAQSGYGQPTNSFSKEEHGELDQYIIPEGKTAREKDLNAAKALVTLMRDSIPQLIYLLKHGIHFPYSEKFPEENAKFFPTYKSGEMTDEEKRIVKVNSYKNAILYTVDPFFEALLMDSISQPFILYYTADHGQNLLDDGLDVTHCRYEKAIPEEGIVPFFAYTNIADYRVELEKAAKELFNKTSQFSIGPSLLVHLGFDTLAVQNKYGRPVWANSSPPQKFITLGIENFFLGIGLKTHITWLEVPVGRRPLK